MLRGILTRQKQLETYICEGKRVRYRSREVIQLMKSQKVGKHLSTWFLRETVQNTLKIQGIPGSVLLKKMQSTLGDMICTEGRLTKFVWPGELHY